ncbi:MAG TPA: type I glyceraldehyde-3-phosphate dehydrogenase [Candidatus Babeliales bacterium]|jgi:glyceraldehyde 3-phosphate dehydrogenase|nr:type I glyceraldehyde-3-phosphate dehydrogenase [Candidatus Babeliales bacterium]
MIRVAISGFGRIGRTFLRCVLQDKKVHEQMEIVAINVGASELESTAHMFKYDTLMGTFPGSVTIENNELVVDGHRITIIAQLDPVKLPWNTLNIDWVVDCTGYFTNRDGAQKHITAGAKYVLISAPAHDEDVAIIPGVNEQLFDRANHKIVSLGSCTTNAFMPMLKVIDDAFGIVRGFMTTTHAYTNSQVLLDVEAKDLRFSRAAALNIIPATTGASKMLGKVLPHLEGKVSAIGIRVPVGKVSLIDLVFEAKKDVSVDALHAAFAAASQKNMKNIVALTMEPLVSSDFSGDPHSVIIDGLLTNTNGTMGQVFGWYDNEWGYSMRMKDFLSLLSR